MKTYIVEWYNKTRNGAWRDYRKVVKTGDLDAYVREKMRLVVGCMAYGGAKGTFRTATEVVETDKFGYDYETVVGGEYWYTKDIKTVKDVTKWKRYYDHKLKCWRI